MDKDGIPNADDMYPLNPKRSRRVEEVLLTEELQKIRQHNKKWKKATRNIAKKEKSKYRIKTVHSTINKLRRSYLHNMWDIGAVRIIVKNEKELKNKVRQLKKKYSVTGEYDYYKKPLNGYYMAHHLIIRTTGMKPVEIQVCTKRQNRLHTKIHEDYKRGKKQDIKKIKKLALKNRKLDNEKNK